jgi:L-lactate dehydrogenase complex protein LldG
VNERDSIFARIREALRVSAVIPGAHDATGPVVAKAGCDGVTSHQTSRDFAPLLPVVGADFQSQAGAFAKASQELRTDFHLLANEAEVHARLASRRDAECWKRVASHPGSLASPIASALGRPVLWTDAGYDKHVLEQCDVGITECDALIAQTGSVLVTSASAGGRALSVLPPHHVVLARRDQVVADLPAAFALLERKYAASYPSMISFITGPSRTGDIERILVLGAHGPRQLTVLCW